MQSKCRFWVRFFAVFLAIAASAVFFAGCDDGQRDSTITFNLNGAEIGVIPAHLRARAGVRVQLPNDTYFSKTGYIFAGWSMSADVTIPDFAGGAFIYMPPSSITLFAVWTPAAGVYFTVTFHSNGGAGSPPASMQVISGGYRPLPDAGGLSRVGFSFVGWSENADGTGTIHDVDDPFTPTRETRLYAIWSFGGDPVPGSALAGLLAWLRDNARDGENYAIELDSDASIAPAQAALPTGRSGVTITLRGSGQAREITPNANGALFTVVSGITLVLDKNITLQGRLANDHNLVRVNDGGTLVMNTGSRITGNVNAAIATDDLATAGGGVRVNNGGVFVMHDGEISNNTSQYWSGAGVQVGYGGRFDLRGGTISNNTSVFFGGGICNQGLVRISGGTIHGNDAAIGLRNTALDFGASLFGAAERGTFNADGVFTTVGFLSSTNNTITVTNGAVGSLPDSAMTITVVGISYRYRNQNGRIIVNDDYSVPVAWTANFRMVGSSATFTMLGPGGSPFNTEGTHRIFFDVFDHQGFEIGAYNATININAGANTIHSHLFFSDMIITIYGLPQAYNDHLAYVELLSEDGIPVIDGDDRVIRHGTFTEVFGYRFVGRHIVRLFILTGSGYDDWDVFYTIPMHLNLGQNRIPFSEFTRPPILWAATPIGSPTTIAIDFTFDNAPTGLNAMDITIAAGSGSATRGSMSGTGTTRTLTVSDVVAGTVYVSINREGIASEPQQVTLIAPPLPPQPDRLSPVNLGDFTGITGSGTAQFTLGTTHGGEFTELRVTNRSGDWHSLNIQFPALIDAGYLTATGTYEVRVTGRGGNPAAGLIMIQGVQGLPDFNWGTTVQLATNAPFSLSRSFNMQPGPQPWADGHWATARFATDADGANADLVFTSVEIVRVAGNAVVWNLADALAVPPRQPDLLTPINIGGFTGIAGAGAAQFTLGTLGGEFVELRIDNRSENWHGMDILFSELITTGYLTSTGAYTVRVTGRGGNSAEGMFMIRGMPNHSWGVADNHAALNADQPFAASRGFTAGGTYTGFRLMTDDDGTNANFVLTSVEVVRTAGGAVVWSLADALAGGASP